MMSFKQPNGRTPDQNGVQPPRSLGGGGLPAASPNLSESLLNDREKTTARAVGMTNEFNVFVHDLMSESYALMTSLNDARKEVDRLRNENKVLNQRCSDQTKTIESLEKEKNRHMKDKADIMKAVREWDKDNTPVASSQRSKVCRPSPVDKSSYIYAELMILQAELAASKKRCISLEG
jgi:FtsZ-binding cell division protein ZapB